MRQITWIVVLAFLVTACGKRSAENAVSYSTSSENEMIPQIESPRGQSTQIQPALPLDQLQNPGINKKKIIKDGRMGLKVTDLEKTKKNVDELVKSNEGYYSNESYTNTDFESSYQLKIRIPAENYEKFITGIESGEAEITYKEIDARDVTDQFIDLETRLNNKRNYLQRYQNFVKQAANIKEILEIEEKIRGLEEEIESTVGKLKYIGDQVDYSTLDLSITQQKEFRYSPSVHGKFTEKLKQSFSKGWYGFVEFFLFMIRIWPVWIIGVILYYVVRRYKQRKRKQITVQKS
jgi:hypothetical protein